MKIQIWSADIKEISDNGATYVLKNKEWNGNFRAGSVIEMSFLGHMTGAPPSGTATLSPPTTVTIMDNSFDGELMG